MFIIKFKDGTQAIVHNIEESVLHKGCISFEMAYDSLYVHVNYIDRIIIEP